jgi:hypothetical protein
LDRAPVEVVTLRGERSFQPLAIGSHDGVERYTATYDFMGVGDEQQQLRYESVLRDTLRTVKGEVKAIVTGATLQRWIVTGGSSGDLADERTTPRWSVAIAVLVDLEPSA